MAKKRPLYVDGYAPCTDKNRDGQDCRNSALIGYPFETGEPRCWHHEAKRQLELSGRLGPGEVAQLPPSRKMA